jgi:hypothetical protein
VCDESVSAEVAAQLNGCALNDDSGDGLPDEDPVDEPEGPVDPEEPQEPGDPGDPGDPKASAATQGSDGARVSAAAVSGVGDPITPDEIMQHAQG